MNPQIWTFFLLITSYCSSSAQIDEQFNGPDLFSSALWQGDTDRFGLTDGRLMLNDEGANASVITHPIAIEDDYEIAVAFNLDFAPSNSNMLTVDLIYRDEDNRLFFQLGETGSDDALEFWSIMDGTQELLYRTADGGFGSDPACASVELQMRRDSLSIAILNCTQGNEQAELSLPSLSGLSGMFRITCDYTATRADRFSFDNIYSGSIRIDSIPPQVIDITHGQQVTTIEFDEAIIEPGSESFIVSPAMITPAEVVNQSGQEISLVWNQDLSLSIALELDIFGVSDLERNILDTTIQFMLTAVPTIGDIRINEILTDPVGSGSDYLEIINISNEPVDVRGLVMSNERNGSSSEIEQTIVLEPQQLLLITEDIANILGEFPTKDESRFIEQDLPTMANAAGELRLIFDGIVIDSFDYDEDLHHFLIDDIEGISLERISTQIAASDRSNWSSASETIGFGTPGLPNSIAGGRGGQNVFNLDTKVVSPNNDGLNDLLELSYALESTDFLGEITIYSDQGFRVASLLNNGTVGSSGSWTWDATDDDGQIVNQGIYVIVVELFNLTDRLTFRESFAVSRG
jgi:hypothetical protein